MPGKHARVPLLVIDDDFTTLDVIQDALSDTDLDIHTATNLEAGFGSIQRGG